MSTLTVSDNKGAKKPQYKDYQSFLGSYKGGKKDDQSSVITNDSGVSFSLTNSSNNSSSSINSDLTDSSKTSFKDYLENYNNKKYSKVQPNFIKKSNKDEEVKTVKTEVFIEINNPPSSVNRITKAFDLNVPQKNTNICTIYKEQSNVSKVSKVFEQNGVPNSNNNKNAFKNDQREAENHNAVDQKKTSIGEISKKFEVTPSNSPPKMETQKVQLKKSSSISQKSKLFEENNSVTNNHNSEENKKQFKVLQQKEDTSPQKTNGSISPKPLINAIKPILTKVFAENNYSTVHQEKIPSRPFQNSITPSPPPPPPPPFITTQITVNNFSNTPPPPPPMTMQTAAPPENLIPPPPPLQTTQNITISIPPPPPLQINQNSIISIPPPPPPPPVNFSTKRLTNTLPRSAKLGEKPTMNGKYSGATIQNGKHNDVIDGKPVPAVDKNDPRVKKLVYGALREMYGAYHDKANDYLATLPKNRVRKNNGLDSIINSIASQGGLEKLNGRVNPTLENE